MQQEDCLFDRNGMVASGRKRERFGKWYGEAHRCVSVPMDSWFFLQGHKGTAACFPGAVGRPICATDSVVDHMNNCTSVCVLQHISTSCLVPWFVASGTCLSAGPTVGRTIPFIDWATGLRLVGQGSIVLLLDPVLVLWLNCLTLFCHTKKGDLDFRKLLENGFLPLDVAPHRMLFEDWDAMQLQRTQLVQVFSLIGGHRVSHATLEQKVSDPTHACDILSRTSSSTKSTCTRCHI